VIRGSCALGFAILVLCAGACSTSRKATTSSICLPSRRTSLSEFECIVRLDPTDKYGWYNLGVIAQNAKDTRTATQDFERAITIDSHFEAALYNLGVLRFNAKDFHAAVTYLSRAVAANPKDANAHWHLGLALARMDTKADNTLAAKQLNTALKLDPNFINTALNLHAAKRTR
jgi:tetratricopeptide (TPR) repeat protein